MTIVVTGASGNLGRLTAAALLERLPASELILLTRTPGKLAAFARRGAVVRHGDFSQPESLPAAFAGGSRALIISTIGGQEAAARHGAAFEAAATAGVQHIFYTSVPNPVQQNPFPPAATHRASEQALRATGVAWTVLRNALYADLRVQIALRYIQGGRWTTNIGEAQHAFIRRQDCAIAAAGALTGDGHEGQTYEITGPELIGSSHYASLLEEFGGRPVECIQADDREFDQYRSAFAADPQNASYIELFTDTGRAIRTGYLSQLTTSAQDLGGRAPMTLREMFDQHRAVFAAGSG
jgi:NAD(P)H dehydrogenase (quinone)